MTAPLWIYFFGLVTCCCGGAQTQKQLLSSSSLAPNVPPLPISNGIPWLVSMSGNCHGIILSRWWILSTAKCLQKMKPSHLNISGVIDPKGLLHGHRICLHPSFEPHIGKYPAKANLGVVLLEVPIYEHNVPLSQVPNMTWKSCSKCRYRQCQIYQLQGIKNFGNTRVKKVSVQLLDSTKCQHQHYHLAETESLCIQSRLHHDCWVQQGSPVLCHLNMHWELVGLVHETSKICHDPTVIIRTAPYLTWIKQFIKASKKRLILTSSLHCKTSNKKETIPQGRHKSNYSPNLFSHKSSAQSLDGSLGISLKTKHPQNPFLGFFNSDDSDSYTGSSKLFPEMHQISQANKFPVEQSQTLPVSRPGDHPGKDSSQYQDPLSPVTLYPWDSSAANTAEPSAQHISDTFRSYDTSKANTPESLGLPVADSAESWDKIMANVVRQWLLSAAYEVEHWGTHATKTTRSWTQPTETTGGPKTQPTDNTAEHLISLTANMAGSWAQPYTTGDEPWTQSSDNRVKFHPGSSHPATEVESWGFIPSGEASDGHQNPLAISKTEPSGSYTEDSTWVPLPAGTVEPWHSSSAYDAVKSQDQSMTNSVSSQMHPASDLGRLQILPVANMNRSWDPSKIVADASLSAASEPKIAQSQLESGKTPSQTQSSAGHRHSLQLTLKPVYNLKLRQLDSKLSLSLNYLT